MHTLNEIIKGPMVRQVWQGWWEVVEVSTGEILYRGWKYPKEYAK